MTAELKYWITPLQTTSVKSPYAVRLTLIRPPENEEEILKWCLDSFGKGRYIVKILKEPFCYAEFYFTHEDDPSAFILRWGDSLT